MLAARATVMRTGIHEMQFYMLTESGISRASVKPHVQLPD
jgi:hypothetical protein